VGLEETFGIALYYRCSRNDMNEVITKQIRDTKENNLSTCWGVWRVGTALGKDYICPSRNRHAGHITDEDHRELRQHSSFPGRDLPCYSLRNPSAESPVYPPTLRLACCQPLPSGSYGME